MPDEIFGEFIRRFGISFHTFIASLLATNSCMVGRASPSEGLRSETSHSVTQSVYLFWHRSNVSSTHCRISSPKKFEPLLRTIILCRLANIQSRSRDLSAPIAYNYKFSTRDSGDCGVLFVEHCQRIDNNS